MLGGVRFLVRDAPGYSKCLYKAVPQQSNVHVRAGRLHESAFSCRQSRPSIYRHLSTDSLAENGPKPADDSLVKRAVRISMAPLNGNVKMKCTVCSAEGAATNKTLSKTDVAAQYGLSPRDLQTVDLPSHGFPHILVRDATILFHVFDLRLLIQADAVLLFHVEGLADATISHVFTYDLEKKLQGHHALHKKTNEAFEFRVLEAALGAVAAGLEAEYRVVRRDVHDLLQRLDEQMAGREEDSVHTALRELLDLGRRLADLEQRARLVRNALQEFLREDQDMAALYLSDKKQGRPHRANEHEEAEYLLEAYFRAHDAVVQEAAGLMANVHRTDDTVRSVLANRRNQIMILETKVEIAMLSMASATLVAGWYGMNTVNFLEENVYAFGVIASASVAGGWLIWMFLLRKLKNIRRRKF